MPGEVTGESWRVLRTPLCSRAIEGCQDDFYLDDCRLRLLPVDDFCSTEDARLITNGVSSPLPIIGTPIPIAGFFYLAPLLLVGMFLYLHLYLLRIWESLADLPAIFPDGTPLDRRATPWLITGLFRSQFFDLKKEELPMFRLQKLIATMAAWWTVPLTMTAFWLWYLRRHDWTGTFIHLGALALCVAFGLWFYQLAKSTLRGQPPLLIRCRFNWNNWLPYLRPGNNTYRPLLWATVLFFFSYVVSFGAINGTPNWQGIFPVDDEAFSMCSRMPHGNGEYEQIRRIVPVLLEYFGLRAFADVSWSEVSPKPSDWSNDDKSLSRVKGYRMLGADLRFSMAFGAFMANANFAGADLVGARLQRADLRNANLFCALLYRSHLDGADLRGASFDSANLVRASMRGVNLGDANLGSANLSKADMRETDLKNTRMNHAVLIDTGLDGSDLSSVLGVTQEQIDRACIDDRTKLPGTLRRPSMRPNECSGHAERLRFLQRLKK